MTYDLVDVDTLNNVHCHAIYKSCRRKKRMPTISSLGLPGGLFCAR
jgi:hypothetical protein